MSIKWFLFDIGDTIYNERLANRQRIERLINKYNLDITCEKFYEEMKKGAVSFMPSPFTAARKKLGIIEDEAYSSEAEFLFPNTVETIQTLSKSYKIGVLANQPLNTIERLKRDGLYELCDLCLLSECENLFKPDPKFFLRAIYCANCEPNEIVMIGDRLDNDVYPAKKVGMRTIRIKQGLSSIQHSSLPEYTADYEINCITELLDIDFN